MLSCHATLPEKTATHWFLLQHTKTSNCIKCSNYKCMLYGCIERFLVRNPKWCNQTSSKWSEHMFVVIHFLRVIHPIHQWWCTVCIWNKKKQRASFALETSASTDLGKPLFEMCWFYMGQFPHLCQCHKLHTALARVLNELRPKQIHF